MTRYELENSQSKIIENLDGGVEEKCSCSVGRFQFVFFKYTFCDGLPSQCAVQVFDHYDGEYAGLGSPKWEFPYPYARNPKALAKILEECLEDNK